MQWLSGFNGFRFRTLFVSLLVVYLILNQAKCSAREKNGVWLATLVYFLLRVAGELGAAVTGLWTYQVESMALGGMPLDIFMAMAVFFGGCSALVQWYLAPRGTSSQKIASYFGLALLATLYDYWANIMYGLFSLGIGNYAVKFSGFFILTLVTASFYAWYTRNDVAE